MNTNNIAVRNSLQQAMLSLMQNKNISEISVTELVEQAKVGRMSFYRNYDSKEAIVLDALRQQTIPLLEEANKDGRAYHWEDLFNIYEVIKPTVELIYKSGIFYLLYDYIKSFNDIYKIDSPQQAYDYTARAGLYFGILDQWASGGFKESREELLVLFKDYLTRRLDNDSIKSNSHG